MRINKDDKETIVNAIIADVKDNGLTEALETAMLAFYVRRLPNAIRELWEDDKAGELRDYVNQACVQLHGSEDGLYSCREAESRPCVSVYAPINQVCDAYREIGPPAVLADPAVSKAHAEWRNWLIKREALRTQVELVLAQCRTTEQVMKILPELEPYLPREVVSTKNLPMATTVATLMVDLGVPPDSIDK